MITATLAFISTKLNEHPKVVAAVGAASGWFSADGISRAKDAAQLGAAFIAGLVSLCALILTAPKAISEVRRWFRHEPKTSAE